MGGLRDDLAVHERALDILIELMKKEQLDESVPLHSLEKAISHFEVKTMYMCMSGPTMTIFFSCKAFFNGMYNLVQVEVISHLSPSL